MDLQARPLTPKDVDKIFSSRSRPTPRGRLNTHTVLDPVTGSSFWGPSSVVGMAEWLSALGHSMQDIDNLNVIHVAGTKGKGSTCSLSAALLQAHGQRTGFPRKVGLYTTPILRQRTDMWRINGTPVSDDAYVKYFTEVCDRLPQVLSPIDRENPDPLAQGPTKFHLWTLLAFHIFLREGVDAAVIETISGGECDATNVIQKPLVTTITPLGMDHVEMLGPTIENIAWHKAGIFKKDAAALARRQAGSSIDAMLDNRAREKGCSLTIVDDRDDPRLPRLHPRLDPEVVRENATLALATVDAFCAKTAARSGRPLDLITNEDVQRALDAWSWEGRFQKVREGATTLYLDAAHNEMSIPVAVRWFAKHASNTETTEAPLKAVLFSQISLTRPITELFRVLAKSCVEENLRPAHVIYASTLPDDVAAPKMRAAFAESSAVFPQIWEQESPTATAKIEVIDTVPAALRQLERIASGRRLDVLAIGSSPGIAQLLQMPGRSFVSV